MLTETGKNKFSRLQDKVIMKLANKFGRLQDKVIRKLEINLVDFRIK